MPDNAERLVLVPRYTTVMGAGPFYTKPINVRSYSKGWITAWRSNGRGGPLTVSVAVEKSADLVTWETLDTAAPAAASEDTVSAEDDREWLRLRTTLSGTGDLAVTLWVVGEFTRRDS